MLCGECRALTNVHKSFGGNKHLPNKWRTEIGDPNTGLDEQGLGKLCWDVIELQHPILSQRHTHTGHVINLASNVILRTTES